MLMWWVMFLDIIPHVLASWFPINEKVFFFLPVLHPIRLHVHYPRPFFSYRSSDDAFGRGVVCLDWGWQHEWELSVIHYHEIKVIYHYPFLVVITELFS